MSLGKITSDWTRCAAFRALATCAGPTRRSERHLRRSPWRSFVSDEREGVPWVSDDSSGALFRCAAALVAMTRGYVFAIKD